VASIEHLKQASNGFLDRLRLVNQADWLLPTPCDDWNVRDLVTHVVAGQAMSVALLRGATRDEGIDVLMSAELSSDPVRQLSDLNNEFIAEFNDPDAFTRVCAHPVSDMSGKQLFGFRLGDLTFHAWDLARAIGADETLAPDVVEKLLHDLTPRAGILVASGMFGAGPSGRLGDDASPQQQLLDLVGRRA